MSRPRIHPAAGGIVRDLREQAGAIVIEQADSRDWSSLTFSGARHRLALRVPDAACALALAEGLASREFAIPRHIVADVGQVSAEGDVLRFEALTIEDC